MEANRIIINSWDQNTLVMKNPEKPPARNFNMEMYNGSNVFDKYVAIRDGTGLDFLADLSIIASGSIERAFAMGQQAPDWRGGTAISLDKGETWTPIKRPPFTTNNYLYSCMQLAAFSVDHLLWIATWGNRPHSTANRGASWEPIVLLDSLGVEITNYAVHTSDNWNILAAASDFSNPMRGLFHHPQVGLWRTIDGARSFQWRRGPIVNSPWQFHNKIKSVWGKPFHYLASPGAAVGQTHPFHLSEDEGLTWTPLDGVTDVWAFDTGVTAPGSSYSTIVIWGRVNGVMGWWLSEDKGLSWILIAEAPDDSLDTIKSVAMSKTHPRRSVLGFAGSGAVYTDGSLVGRRRAALKMVA